ncbi:hypothetical protein OG618_36850 [Kitasatospora sp. NBC_01246]|uniref:hypothetical protein n=1 Tax=Kitasatospora sp. NBC_01246 TaxID=2903570 RepID=UPI002E336EFB|nr:hypothetical protein [Kitasatospora sp. NBC_01246]
MIPDRTTPNARLLRRALALYPDSYGAHELAELTDHAERHVRTAGPLAGLREVADVAGHGARVRLGLVSHRPMGRALATAAPLAAVLAGTYAAWDLWYTLQMAIDHGFDQLGPSGTRAVAVRAMALAPATLMAIAVLAGRWTTARILALVTVLATPLLAALHRPEAGAGLPGRPSPAVLIPVLIRRPEPPGRGRPAAPHCTAGRCGTVDGGILTSC